MGLITGGKFADVPHFQDHGVPTGEEGWNVETGEANESMERNEHGAGHVSWVGEKRIDCTHL